MDVLMPQLGETVAEGKITKWFKSAGEAVKPGDNLFEIETDKVSMEVPSTTTGVLSEIRVAGGDVAPVGAVVGIIADGSALSASARPPPCRRSSAGKVARRRRRRAAAAPACPPAPRANQRKPDQARSVLRSAHAGSQFRPGAACRRHFRHAAGAAAGRPKPASIFRGCAAPARTAASSPATSKTRRGRHARRRSRPEARAPPRSRRSTRPDSYEEVPLDGMRRTIAARLTQAADRAAFLSDDRRRHRPADRVARGGQRRRAQGQRRQCRRSSSRSTISCIRALALALAARAGGECGLGRRPHPALQAFRYRRRGGARRRLDHAGHPQCRNQIAVARSRPR